MRKALPALLSDQRDNGASCVSFRVANPCHPHDLSDQLMSAMAPETGVSAIRLLPKRMVALAQDLSCIERTRAKGRPFAARRQR